jgi:hypothetical protein
MSRFSDRARKLDFETIKVIRSSAYERLGTQRFGLGFVRLFLSKRCSRQSHLQRAIRACRGIVELDFFYPSPAPTEDKRAVTLGFSRSFRWPCSGDPSSQLSLLAHQPLQFIDLLAELLQLQKLLSKSVLRRGLV